MATDNRDSRRLSSANKTQQPSSIVSDKQRPMLPASVTGAMFLDGLERLVSSKRTLELTDHQTETWLAALSMYAENPKIVNRAIIQLAVDDDPFPDLAKLLAKCERIRREMENTLPQDSPKIKFQDVKTLAKAWGLEV